MKDRDIEEIRRKIRSGEIKVTSAGFDKVKQYFPYIELVLYSFGLRSNECFITDESIISDFAPDKTDFSREAEQLGLKEVKGTEYIWEVAKRIEDNERRERRP